MTTPDAIALTTTVARSDDLICTERGNEVVLMRLNPDSAEMDDDVVTMNLEQGEYFGLDAVGSRIWALLEHPMTVAELSQQLLASYAVDIETCQQDTLDFLQELYAVQIITIVEP